MSDQGEVSNKLPLIDVTGLSDDLGKLLLEGKWVAYHDNQYEVTSGTHQIIMKLLQQEDGMLLLYVHVPYAYPIPEGVKANVKKSLESVLKKTIQRIDFMNAGTETQKKDIQFRIELGGEIK